MQFELKSRFEKVLNQRQRDDNLRTLKLPKDLIDFCSNDYLGFASSPVLKSFIQAELIAHSSEKIGSTGSRLLSGNSRYAEQLEDELALFFGSEASLLFNSGFDANLGLLQAVAQRNDTIILDENVHASMHAGAKLSAARKFNFKHNDAESLRAKIRRSSGQVFICVESIYSMDGDVSPLIDLVKLSKEEGAHLIVDEAHSTAIVGPSGQGMVSQLELQDDVFAVIYTFGKGMGSHGACIAGSKLLKEYLINFSMPFIYSTAMSFIQMACIRMALHYMKNATNLRESLQKNIVQYKSELSLYGNLTNNATSPIQCLLISGTERCRNASNELQHQGFDIRPIFYPTVPRGLERLRICLHAFNESWQISSLTNQLSKYLK